MRRKRHWSYAGEKLRRVVFERDGYRCQIAGEGCLGVADVIDHIVPHGLDGPDVLENLRAACHSCNSRKGRKATLEAAAKGGPFFKDTRYRTGQLPNLSPRSDWERLTDGEYRKNARRRR